ncbi:MAG: FAD-dependent oxidoreductase, partial [Chloroflexota bacterium]
MTDRYDLIVIGAGSGGITAAEFGAKLGISVALIEREKIGGDCTWTGCVPSKALLKVANVAHQVRTAEHYGIENGAPQTIMHKVKAYLEQVIEQVYQHETPETFQAQGIDVLIGTATFLDSRTIQVGERRLSGKRFVIATGASPFIPAIPDLDKVPYQT